MHRRVPKLAKIYMARHFEVRRGEAASERIILSINIYSYARHFLNYLLAIIRIYFHLASPMAPAIKFDCQTFADIWTRVCLIKPNFRTLFCLCCRSAGDFTLLVCCFSRFCFAVKLQIAVAIVSASPALALA